MTSLIDLQPSTMVGSFFAHGTISVVRRASNLYMTLSTDPNSADEPTLRATTVRFNLLPDFRPWATQPPPVSPQQVQKKRDATYDDAIIEFVEAFVIVDLR